MNNFTDQLKRFFGRLSTGQKVGLGIVVGGTTILLVGLAYWANLPSYGLLFGNLDSQNANQIVETLREEGTPYRLSDGGRAIHVPRDEIYEMRMRFASEGIVSNGPAGYDLFDENTLGMTDFMQKLNRKRAIEGELAQTISGIRQVEQARVHLVVPERRPFREQQSAATASVIVSMAGSRELSAAQVNGITSLVAGAVENLSSSDVTVLDSEGNMLSDPSAGDPTARLTSTQMELQDKVQKRLIESGQSMLNEVLGRGRSIVRVAADLNFDQEITESQTIDPESRTIISEETLEEQDQAAGQATSQVRNYEVSRTQTRREGGIGEVDRLTVSVVLDQPRQQPVEESANPEPARFTEAEVAQLENLVKNAVGFNEGRGDQFSIHQAPFTRSVEDQLVTQMQREERNRRYEQLFRFGVIALALLLMGWLIHSTSKNLMQIGENGPLVFDQDYPKLADDKQPRVGGTKKQAPKVLPEEDEEELELVDDRYMSKLSDEARQRLRARHKLYNEIKNSVTSDPAQAASRIRSWLSQKDVKETNEKPA